MFTGCLKSQFFPWPCATKYFKSQGYYYILSRQHKKEKTLKWYNKTITRIIWDKGEVSFESKIHFFPKLTFSKELTPNVVLLVFLIGIGWYCAFIIFLSLFLLIYACIFYLVAILPLSECSPRVLYKNIMTIKWFFARRL